tara:strand:- start:1950 stop:2060 length:111 start_codon:yes stop_codon:yes gene_type:complete
MGAHFLRQCDLTIITEESHSEDGLYDMLIGLLYAVT